MTQRAAELRRFRATLELNGKTATGIRVPPDVIAGLGGGKRPAVRVTLGGHTYRTTVAPRADRYLISVSADVRAVAGVAAGDDLDVAIELDTEPRAVSVPADFAGALDLDPDARRIFDGLSFSRQQWFVLGIEDAKKPATRQRRIAKAVTDLREGRAQR